jgi:hypothetical protein
LNCFALDGRTVFFIEGKTFFDFLSPELGGLLELELDLVLLFSVGVWNFVFSLAPPIAELKTAYS